MVLSALRACSCLLYSGQTWASKYPGGSSIDSLPVAHTNFFVLQERVIPRSTAIRNNHTIDKCFAKTLFCQTESVQIST